MGGEPERLPSLSLGAELVVGSRRLGSIGAACRVAFEADSSTHLLLYLRVGGLGGITSGCCAGSCHREGEADLEGRVLATQDAELPAALSCWMVNSTGGAVPLSIMRNDC